MLPSTTIKIKYRSFYNVNTKKGSQGDWHTKCYTDGFPRYDIFIGLRYGDGDSVGVDLIAEGPLAFESAAILLNKRGSHV